MCPTACNVSRAPPTTTTTTPAAGVVGGIAALKALKDAGFVPARPLEVVMFTSEEPTRFALSCSGSRAMAGAWLGGYVGCVCGGGGGGGDVCWWCAGVGGRMERVISALGLAVLGRQRAQEFTDVAWLRSLVAVPLTGAGVLGGST
jgi:hypothetical protein